MGKQLSKLSDQLTDFIGSQPLFFVATAPGAGKVNCSPKGMDSLRVLSPNRIIWLNVTGSGNETAAHVLENGRMTLMWCAFSGPPLILRAYGKAKMIQPADPEWDALSDRLPDIPGARQIFDLQIDMVQTSCGMAVPYLDFKEDRNQLREWSAKKSEEELKDYHQKKNAQSLDGLPTGLPTE
ncbi:pyridoxamine 5'-phosphate oxidase family protein [Neolewinella agarilytica]|uniref:Pyridoxamine 5'-phosphate oxidase n=1 Tax=Neolewinella agarilytica TaxID=478744 RepID=A0A1H9M1K3_9BACT|nr:pyridoxamine 5'-phosphate oxidase family protein [Neolewinella agarilytica]SER17524.1 Pyridoxamine 5'-phosphate oxidase [Neolewinella agarilytica]